jgi:hypothetical protein
VATDLYGRSIGDNVSVNQVNQQLLSPTQETKRPDTPEVNNDSDKKESALENLYDAINRVAEKIDSNASKDLEESKNWSKNIVDFHKDFRGTSRSEESGQKTQTGFLDLASKAIQNLWVASQSQNTIWVGISKLSNNAVQEISKSFSMSDCCESLGEATNVVKGLDNFNSGVSEASKTVLSQAGGGGSGINWGGGRDDSDDGGDDGSGRRRRRRSDSPDDSDFEFPDAGDMTGVIARMSTLAGLASLAANSFVDLHRSVIKALDIDAIQKIFDGQILEHNNFRESIRALIHEQEGFGASNRQIEKTFINLESSINAAGVGSAKFKTMYLKNLERGLSLATAEDNRYVDALAAQKKGFTIEQKESALRVRKVNRLKSIQTTALSTASSLHMSSDAMNELFMNWHMNLGLSEQSLAEIGSHMKNVSRSTGVTGSQLEKAMISADGVMKNLKKAGMVSTDTAKRVTEFMAAAQKHGFEGAAEMMNVLGGGESFHDSKYKLFLGNAARFSDKPQQGVRDLVLGNTMNRSGGMENLFGGAERFVRSQLSGFETALNSVGLKSSTLDVTNLSEVMNKLRDGGKLEEAEALKRRFKGLGIEIGEVERALKTMQEETLSSSQRIDKYSKELESMKAQGLEKTDAFKQLEKKLLEAQTGASQDVFGRIKSVMDNKEGKTGGQLEKELKDSLIQVLGDEKAAAEWQSNLPAKASEAVSQMRERAESEGLNFNDMLKEKGITGGESQLTKGLLEGDALSNQAMTEIMQRISREEKAGEDPITDLKKTLDLLHTMLAQKLDNVGFGLSDMIVKILYVAGYLGGILMTVASGILALRMLQNIPGLLSGISGVFGGLNKALGNPLEKIFGKGGKGPLGGLLGDCLPVCPPSGGGGQMMPRRPTGGSPVVPPPPTTGPMTTVNPSGRPRNTTVLPGGPDYGGGGWAGAQGTQYQSPTVRDAATGQVTRRDMSRSDRRANAERYLDARRAAGQSGRGFGPRAGSGIRRVAPQGKGWMGLAGKIANFAMRNPEATLGTIGAGVGYATSDSKTTMGALGDAALGGGIGAAAGHGARRLGGMGKGLQAGGLPGIADGVMDVAASGANMMGMPGFGSDCMPVWVCNFNEMGGMGGLLPGMGGGGMAQTALDTLNTVDMASDVAGMVGKGKNVAQVADKVDDAARVVSKVAGGADDAAKGVGLLSKIPGAGMLSKIPGAGMLKGVGSLLGKVAAPLQIAIGGITGAMEAESAGRTTAEGAAYGILTGGVHKGSMFSEALGVQKGSVADESLGVAGAAASGAMLGAGVGTILAPFTAGISVPVAAAVGGVIGAGAELVKVFTAEESSMRDAVTGFASSIGSTIMELPGTIGGAFQTVGSYLGEGAYSIYASVTGFASSLGSTFTSGITSVANGIGGFASNLGNSVSESFSSTAKENWDRMLQGASFSGALGQVTGGIIDVVNGNLTQGLTKVGLSGVEAFGALGQTILGAASSLNPFSWFKDKNKTPAKEAESSPEKKLAETTNKETQKTQQDVVAQSAEKLQEAANGMGLNIGKTEQDLKTISEPYDGEIDPTTARVTEGFNLGASKEISKALPTQNSEVFNSILAEQESLLKSISQRKLEKLNVNAVDVKDVQSSLQDSSNIIQKQSAPVETTASLQGVFDKTQASEALTSNIDTALKWQKIEPSEQALGDSLNKEQADKNNITVYDQSVESILFRIFDQLKSFGLTNVFDKNLDQGMKKFESNSSDFDTQKITLETHRQFEALGVSVGEFAEMYKSFKDSSSMESSLQDSSNIIQKQSAPVETTTSLQGVFDKTQASEALTSNIDAAIKWQKIEPSGSGSDFDKKWNTLKDNEFDDLESKSPMKRMFGYDGSEKQNKMSYQGTGAGAALGAALGGPIGIPAGAAAGFVYDAFSSNLNIQDALSQTISNIGENTKGALNSLSLGLFDNEKAAEAQDSSLEYSIKNIAPGLIAGSLAGVTGGASSLALPMINQLMQGQPSDILQQVLTSKQINKPEISSNQLGLFDNEKAAEAQDSSLEYSIKNITPSLIAGSLSGVTGGMSSLALPMINQLMQGQPNQKNIETSELLKEKFKEPEGFIEANPQSLGVFDFEKTGEAEEGYFKQLGASYVDPKDFMTTAPIPIVGDIINLLSNVGSKIFGSTKGSVGVSSLGMFDPSQPSEANDSESDLMLKKIQGSQNFDLNRYNLSAIENSIKNKSNLEKNIVLETSRALDYDRQASEAADSAKINELDYRSDKKGDIESNPMDYTDDMGNQSVNPTYMDYRDQMKGEVGTLGISRYGMESAVMQSKYGEQPTGNSSILPSMDTIANYLTGMQSTKLDMMIKHLQEIRDRLSTQTTSYSNIVGSAASGVAPPEATGVKSIARDFVSGSWDLPYGDYTSGTVNTEGRV